MTTLARWKYALGLELHDPGFDHTVLSEFRTRLVAGHAELLLLNAMLARFKDHGLLKTRGKQRTDSTHVLTSVRVMSRHESLAETLRAALNTLATTHPEWLVAFIPTDWYSRYGRRIEEFRLPKGKPERALYIQQVGRDGFLLLDTLERDSALVDLWQQPNVQLLHLAWSQHFSRDGEDVVLREGKDLCPASERFNSPYDPEAHYANKGSRSWQGYKMHLTETCDDDVPHLVTHARTTPAAQGDIEAMVPIHTALAAKQLQPKEHFVDTGYVSTDLMLTQPKKTGIDAVGPIRPITQWQGSVEGAYSSKDFQVDWKRKKVTCPQGQLSRKWCARQDATGRNIIAVRFARRDCLECPARARCTRNVSGQPREITLLPKALHLARAAQRVVQQSPEWKQAYHRRAGIEGTISQGSGHVDFVERAIGVRQKLNFRKAVLLRRSIFSGLSPGTQESRQKPHGRPACSPCLLSGHPGIRHQYRIVSCPHQGLPLCTFIMGGGGLEPLTQVIQGKMGENLNLSDSLTLAQNRIRRGSEPLQTLLANKNAPRFGSG